MTPEDRIAALEQELVRLRTLLTQTAHIHQELSGHARMFQAAVLALIATHPAPELLRPFLENNLARLEASIVAQSAADEQLTGAHDAQVVLMAALSSAIQRDPAAR